MITLPIPGVIDYYRTGSRYICTPPVTDTDDDYVVLVQDTRSFIHDARNAGYEASAKDSCADHSEFMSFRKDDINLIVTDDLAFFGRFNAATEVAKRLNLRNKNDRIMLFQAVLYGKEP